jgi:hypothetical protein
MDLELVDHLMEEIMEQEDSISVAHLMNWFAWTTLDYQPEINLAQHPSN